MHIIINVAGCLIRGRRRWSVTYTSPRGLYISEFEIEGHFRRENRKTPYYCPGRGANPRPPAHPRLHNKQGSSPKENTRSAIGSFKSFINAILIS